MSELTDEEREYLQRRNNIHYKYAKPYLSPVANEDAESKQHLRQRVREGLQYLSRSERVELRAELKEAYEEVYGYSHDGFL